MRRLKGQTKTKCPKKRTRVARNKVSLLCMTKMWPLMCNSHAYKPMQLSYADAVLLIVAEKAFNSLNRKLALKNIKNSCPFFLATINNSYLINLNCS